MNRVFTWVKTKRRGSFFVAPLEIGAGALVFLIVAQLWHVIPALAAAVLVVGGLVALRVRDHDRDDSLELRIRSLLLRKRFATAFDDKPTPPYAPED